MAGFVEPKRHGVARCALRSAIRARKATIRTGSIFRRAISPRVIYKYEPAGNDVTFRLEVVENSGRVSAESFRFVRTARRRKSSVATAATAGTPQRPPRKQRRSFAGPSRRRSIGLRRSLPQGSVLASPAPIAIDVRVHIDEQGRVTSAAPVVKPQQGLDAYLAGTAVQAARLWRFEPARENGKAVAGTQTIHFVFQK